MLQVEVDEMFVKTTERKLRTFRGEENFRHWREDAEGTVLSLGLEDKAAAAFIYAALDATVKREIRLQKSSAMVSAKSVLDALQVAYGDQRNLSQRKAAFFKRKQEPGESVVEFSHALFEEMESINELETWSDDVREDMLKEVFVENVQSEPLLHWELKKRKSEMSFIKLRKIAIDWHNNRDSKSTDRRSKTPVVVRQTATATLEARVTSLEELYRELSDVLKRVSAEQNDLVNRLTDVHKIVTSSPANEQSPSSNNRARLWCHWCRKPGHRKSDCMDYQEHVSRQQSGNV